MTDQQAALLNLKVAQALGWDTGWSDPTFRHGGPHWREPHTNTIHAPGGRFWATDMGAAWQLVEEAGGWLFSRRRDFFDRLGRSCQEQTAPGVGPVRVAWPAALLYLTPQKICEAFVATGREGEGEVRL
jgi:hypothetical protein